MWLCLQVFKSHCAPEPQADAAPLQQTIAQLKVALRSRGLPLSGRKAELAERLAAALAQVTRPAPRRQVCWAVRCNAALPAQQQHQARAHNLFDPQSVPACAMPKISCESAQGAAADAAAGAAAGAARDGGAAAVAEAEASAAVVVTEAGDVKDGEAGAGGAGEAGAAGPAADIKPGTADLQMASAEVPTFNCAQCWLVVAAVTKSMSIADCMKTS